MPVPMTCKMLLDLGVGDRRTVYEDEFEKPFLHHSAHFYKNEAQAMLAENGVSDYIQKVEQRFAEEAQRARRLLDASTVGRIVAVVIDELVTKNAQTIFDMEGSGMVHMMAN